MKIAVMGYGVVGSGVVEVFYRNHKTLLSKSKQNEMEIKYILDIRDFPGDPFENKIIRDFNLIVNDPEIDIVVETMGGIRPAFEFVSRCLEAGKHVVTSNKELVAEKGIELFRMAESNNINFMFEASVGGGIPIIRPLNQCLAANEIDEIAGILNGTTNFILTKMIREKMDFAEALTLAQKLGYAEKDPTADVDGHDTCRKICILSSLAFGKHVYPSQIHTEGIRNIALEDVEYVSSWGGVIKLLGYAKKMDQNLISAAVSPAIVKNDSQLASVEDVFNAILIRGNATGDVVFYGRGAGKLPTASAVVADVIDCVNHISATKSLGWDQAEEGYVSDYLCDETALYVRAKWKDSADAIHAIKEKVGKITELSRKEAPEDEIAFITERDTERRLRRKLADIEGLEVIHTIRVTEY